MNELLIKAVIGVEIRDTCMCKNQVQEAETVPVNVTFVEFSDPPNVVDVPIDVSTATTQEVVAVGPNGASLVKSSTFVTDGTDGKIAAVIDAGELDEKGFWKVQGRVVLPGSIEYKTQVVEVEVLPNV